jgi:hypothetical protein
MGTEGQHAVIGGDTKGPETADRTMRAVAQDRHCFVDVPHRTRSDSPAGTRMSPSNDSWSWL